MAKVKITELPESTSTQSMYTIGVDAEGKSVKVPIGDILDGKANVGEGGKIEENIDWGKVLISEPFIVTKTVGALTPKTYPAGTSVQKIFDDMLSETRLPTPNNPKVSISITAKKVGSTSAASSFEIGTSIEVSFTITYTDGYFSLDGANTNAGCKLTWKGVTGNKAYTIPTDKAHITPITVSGHETSHKLGASGYQLTVAASYGASTVSVNDNKGKPSGVTIPASTANITSKATISAYKCMFYGFYKGTADPEDLSGSEIRNIGTIKKVATTTTTLEIEQGTSAIIIACPDTHKLSSYKLYSKLESSISIPLSSFTLDIPDASGVDTYTCTVYYIKPENPFNQGVSIDFTIAKKS